MMVGQSFNSNSRSLAAYVKRCGLNEPNNCMKIVLIVYVISWVIVLGAVVVRAIRNGLNYFKKDPWYFYLLLFALAPFCILIIVIPSALMNCF